MQAVSLSAGRSVWLAVTLIGVGLAGCGGSGVERVNVVPVQTKVLFEGRPLAGAFVVLHPKANSNPKVLPARGYVDKEGNLKPTTYDAGDGVAPGDYAVTVEWRQLVQIGSDYEPGPNVLPPRYANPQTTDLQIRVAEGAKEVPPLNLTR